MLGHLQFGCPLCVGLHALLVALVCTPSAALIQVRDIRGCRGLSKVFTNVARGRFGRSVVVEGDCLGSLVGVL